MNINNYTGITVAPTWHTVAGSLINFGTIIGVNVVRPKQALFSTSAGTERLAAFYGLQIENPNINNQFGTAPMAAVRSEITAGTNKHFLLNSGGAASYHGAGHIYFADNFGVAFGGAGVPNFDSWISWNASINKHRLFLLASSVSFYTSAPAANRILMEVNNASAGELNINVAKFSLGVSASAVGNQVGNFVAGNRSAGVAGGWADFLLTQSGQLTLGTFAMSDVSAWVVNSISFASSAYSISELATFRVGGMTTSNPGGTVTNRAGLWARGRSRFEGAMEYPPINPTALAAGDNDDWAGLLTASPTNNTRHWARISGVSGSRMTGIDATTAQDGDTFELTNVGTFSIALTHQDAASAAANRIISPSGANYLLGVNETVLVRYDSITARWRLLAGTGA